MYQLQNEMLPDSTMDSAMALFYALIYFDSTTKSTGPKFQETIKEITQYIASYRSQIFLLQHPFSLLKHIL